MHSFHFSGVSGLKLEVLENKGCLKSSVTGLNGTVSLQNSHPSQDLSMYPYLEIGSLKMYLVKLIYNHT